jgi:hypothetical protein
VCVGGKDFLVVVCVCLAGPKKRDILAGQPSSPAVDIPPIFSFHEIFPIRPLLMLDSFFLSFQIYVRRCSSMELPPPPSPWSQIPKPIPQPHLLPVPRNLRVSGGAPHQFTSEVTSARLRGGQVGRKKAILVKLGA